GSFDSLAESARECCSDRLLLNPMKRTGKAEHSSARQLLIELAIYSVLVLIYFFAVLHFLGDHLKQVFDFDKRVYAAVALGLMVGQGFGLEMLTRWLLKVIRAKSD